MSSDYETLTVEYDPDTGHIFDAETGEVIDHLRLMQIAVPKRTYRGKSYFYAMQPDFKKVATMGLRPAAIRVLLWMTGEMDFGNEVAAPQTQMAEELDLTTSTVSKAIKQLLGENLIVKGRKIGTSWTYRLNANMAWKGKIKLRDDVAENHPALFPEKNDSWGEA